MTIEVTIVVNERGRIEVNPNPIRVPSFAVEEIRWTILGKSGWRFGGPAGIAIHPRRGGGSAEVRKTFLHKKLSGNATQISVIDVNTVLQGITAKLGKRLRQPPRRFKYDIVLVKPGHRPKRLDPTIENRGC